MRSIAFVQIHRVGLPIAMHAHLSSAYILKSRIYQSFLHCKPRRFLRLQCKSGLLPDAKFREKCIARLCRLRKDMGDIILPWGTLWVQPCSITVRNRISLQGAFQAVLNSDTGSLLRQCSSSYAMQDSDSTTIAILSLNRKQSLSKLMFNTTLSHGDPYLWR